MDISKFDFTKFSEEKWEKILTVIGGCFNEIEDIKVRYDIVNHEIVPSVTIQYYYETDFDGSERYYLTFTAFELESKDEDEDLTRVTKEWRRIMLKEFGDVYYNSLVSYLNLIKEQKHQAADEEYEDDLRDLNRALYY